MTGQVVVAVVPAVASVLHRGDPAGSAEATRLLEFVEGLGARLRPQHPGVHDPGLARWFVLERAAGQAPDGDWSERAVQALAGQPGVDGAFVKPPDALPG